MASVTWLALALVATHHVETNSTVATWALNTFVDVNLTCLTLPSFRADAGEALVVFRLLTYSTIFTGSGATRCQQDLTVFTSVGQQTVALVSSHIIDAGALVEARVGGTLVDVSLAVRSSEASSACAVVSACHVLAGSAVHAWIGLALVVIDVTVWAAPAGVTSTFVAVNEVLAPAMDAGVTSTLIYLRQAGGVVVAFRTQAGEAVDAINACASIVTGVDGAFINVDVAHCPCVAGFACTFVAVDFINAPSVVAGFALTVVQVHLTVETCSAFGAGTNVCVLPVLTSATILAWLAQTLIDISLTQAASVARAAVAGEGGEAVFAGAIVARVRVALVDVGLTVLPGVTFSTFTGILVGTICALCPIFARGAGTFINVYLAQTS